jgi:hypothetical protein
VRGAVPAVLLMIFFGMVLYYTQEHIYLCFSCVLRLMILNLFFVTVRPLKQKVKLHVRRDVF